MKKLLYILLLLPWLVSAQKGSIKGKVFYIYNNYVRDRADVGSKVLLIAKNDKSFRKETTVDLQGNYSIPDLEPGDYLLVITSKNTKEDPITSLESLLIYTDFLTDWSDSLPYIFKTKKYDSVQNKIQEYKDGRDSKKIKEKKLQNMQLALHDLINQFYIQLPFPVSFRLDIKLPDNKMKFELARIRDKEINVVTDFGISGH
jgi:hypothetical protein